MIYILKIIIFATVFFKTLFRRQGGLIPVQTSCLSNNSSPSLPRPTSNTLDSAGLRSLTPLVPTLVQRIPGFSCL